MLKQVSEKIQFTAAQIQKKDSNDALKYFAIKQTNSGLKPFLNKFEIMAFSDFFIAINKPFERKNIGYAGKINAQIFKYLEPNSITTGSLEKKLIIRSDNMYKNIPDTIIIRNEYFIEVKYVSLTLSKFLAPKF